MTYVRPLVQLLVFIGFVVLLTAVAEWQNNVLSNPIERGWVGYKDTLLFNALILGIPAYASFVLLRRYFSAAGVLYVQYLLWGFLGLMFEWFAIGHFPWSYAVQTGMVTYWAAVFTVPAAWLLMRQITWRVWASVYIGIGSIVMASFSGLVWVVSGQNPDYVTLSAIIGWFFFYAGLLHLILRSVGMRLSAGEFWLLALVAPLAEILSFGFGLIAVKILVSMTVLIFVHQRIMRRYKNQLSELSASGTSR